MTQNILDSLLLIDADAIRNAESQATAIGSVGVPPQFPFERSLAELTLVRDQLLGAIEGGKMSMVPMKKQREMLQHIDQIKAGFASLSSGQDDRVAIAEAIEDLYNVAWDSGIHNLSDKFLGYQSKMNSIKDIEAELIRGREALQDGLSLIEKITGSSRAIFETEGSLKAKEKAADDLVIATTDRASKVTASELAAQTTLASIQKTEATITQSASDVQASKAQVTTTEARVKEFFDEITKYRAQITATEDEANKALVTNRTEVTTMLSDATKALNAAIAASDKSANDSLLQHNSAMELQLEEVKKVDRQIKDQLQKVTGVTFFEAFQKRAGELAKSKNRWLWFLSGLLACAVGAAYWISWDVAQIATSHPGDGWEFALYLRFAISLPIIYALYFCSSQYIKERKLEEEYEFKSKISASLVPYKDLVEMLVDVTKEEERKQYALFLIDTITKVFTSPTDKIYHTKADNHEGLDPSQALKSLGELTDSIGKTLEPLTKLLKNH